MDMINYLENLPYSQIVRYSESPPKNAVAFSGFPKQHPTEKNKLILIHDPLSEKPIIVEFKLEDVLFVEDVHSAVTETGEGVRLVKLWIRKGAHGVIIEPFEVNKPVHLKTHIKETRDKLFRSASL